jgi:hypothetical protein
VPKSKNPPDIWISYGETIPEYDLGRTRPACARIVWLSAIDWTLCKDWGLARLESWLSTDERS